MLETLEKWSGKTHTVRKSSRNITRNLDKTVGESKNSGSISYTQSINEEPVISMNDMLNLPMRNAIVFRAGSSPIWDRRETVLPMSFKLLGANPIRIPGKSFSLETIPTNSTAKDFDVRKNQPDFLAMLNKRLKQAREVDTMITAYKEAHGYTDDDLVKLDPDEFSDEIMAAINDQLYPLQKDAQSDNIPRWKQEGYANEYRFRAEMARQNGHIEVMEQNLKKAILFEKQAEQERAEVIALERASKENVEVTREAAKQQNIQQVRKQPRFAGVISQDDLINEFGQVQPGVINTIGYAYGKVRRYFEKDDRFVVSDNGALRYNGTLFVKGVDNKELRELSEATENEQSRVFSDANTPEELEEDLQSTAYTAEAAFVKYLEKQESWTHIAGGRFEEEMQKQWENA